MNLLMKKLQMILLFYVLYMYRVVRACNGYTRPLERSRRRRARGGDTVG